MNYYKRAQLQISRQEVRDVINRWGSSVVMALGYLSNPANINSGNVTINLNEFERFQEIIPFAKNKFEQLQTSSAQMDDAQFDRNIVNFVHELIGINNYIKQYIRFFGIQDTGRVLQDFDNILSKWVGV